ncbi:MAG: transposase [Verrucomicrobia bacterium]|nr:transposase [Verrucomicrobiota bacterium]
MVDQPDHTVRHLVGRCTGCGCSLANQQPDRLERRQVFDLPEPKLEPVEVFIRDLVAKSKVVGFDETDMRAVGSLHGLHTAPTQCLTWYFAHQRRGSEAMDAAGILPNFQGRAIHDFWSSYLKHDCKHGLCNGHLLRELIFLWEEQNQP